MLKKFSTILFALLIYPFFIKAQDSLIFQPTFPEGISIEFGLGHYAVKDEYISKEKYSGTLPHYSLGWARNHGAYVYHLDLFYRNSSNIENNNVSTDITQFTLNQGFLYPTGKISLFRKSLELWLGPSSEFFFFYNDQNIAVSGFDYAQSSAGLFSIGLFMKGIYPLRRNLQAETSLQLSALSLGFRTVDNEEEDQSAVKFLTAFSGLNYAFDLGLCYHLFKRLSVKLAYQFELTRISAWEPLHSASDNLIIGLNFKF